MYQKVNVTEAYEVLRQWESGSSYRAISRQTGLARRTVTRYVKAAQECGLKQGGGPEQITQEIQDCVFSRIRVGRHEVEKGEMWRYCEMHKDKLEAWVEDKIQVKEMATLLHRQTGVKVPYSTLLRYVKQETGYKGKKDKRSQITGQS